MAQAPVAVADVVPPPLTFSQVAEGMRAFANVGLKDCKVDLEGLPTDARGNALRTALAPSAELIGDELNDGKLLAKTNNRFLPLPSPKHLNKNKRKKSKSFFLAFFRPSFSPRLNPSVCEIDLLMICKDQKTVFGASFEAGSRSADPHRHAHMQFRKEFDNYPTTDMPDPFVQSYPAFTTRVRPIGDTWICVLVSLYGLSTDRSKGLTRIANEASKGGQFLHMPQMMARAEYLFHQG